MWRSGGKGELYLVGASSPSSEMYFLSESSMRPKIGNQHRFALRLHCLFATLRSDSQLAEGALRFPEENGIGLDRPSG